MMPQDLVCFFGRMNLPFIVLVAILGCSLHNCGLEMNQLHDMATILIQESMAIPGM